jgi:hypothetical protein
MALATALRVVFALAFPAIHGGDASARLAHADTLILGYQLPLPQVFVALGKWLADDPLIVRLVFCAWGGALAAGVAALLARTLGARAALFGGLLLSFDPLLTHYSIVPYQEPVAYALLAWAFFCASTGRAVIGGLLMAAACLSRYEAWLFLPIFWWVSRSRIAVLLGAAPVLGWVLWWQGLAPRGLYVLDIDVQANRLSRVVYLAGKFVEYESAAIVALALVALVLAARLRTQVVLKFAGALAIVIAVAVALGHEYPPGSGLMSERLIHLPVLVALSLAAFALARVSAMSRAAFAAALGMTLLLAGRNLRFERALLRAAAADPDLALARDVARAIEAHRRPTECVTVIAPAVDPALLDAYVAKVGTAFGDVDRARAQADLLRDVSPDRDRIAAHLKSKTGTVRAEPGCPLLVVVDPAGDPGQALGNGTLLEEVSAGPRRARVLRTRE